MVARCTLQLDLRPGKAFRKQPEIYEQYISAKGREMNMMALYTKRGDVTER